MSDVGVAVKHKVMLHETSARERPKGSCSCGNSCTHLAAALLLKGRSVERSNAAAGHITMARNLGQRIVLAYAKESDEKAKCSVRARTLWRVLLFDVPLSVAGLTPINIALAKSIVCVADTGIESLQPFLSEDFFSTRPETDLRKDHGFSSPWNYFKYD